MKHYCCRENSGSEVQNRVGEILSTIVTTEVLRHGVWSARYERKTRVRVLSAELKYRARSVIPESRAHVPST